MRARVASLVVLGLIFSGAAARAELPGCSDASRPGEWRSYGGTLTNSRTQADETVLNAGNVGNVAPAWRFRTTQQPGGTGAFSNTPIVADGCVYVATNTGWVFALNADTGARVWMTKFSGAGQTLLGGVIVGSPVVANGIVFVGVSRPGTPYVAAIDQATGDKLWIATVEGYSEATKQTNSLINASPVYFDGMIFQGISGNEGGSVARGGYALVDASRDCDPANMHIAADPSKPIDECFSFSSGATGGSIIAHEYTINDAEYKAGYRGASVWCTAAVDEETKSAYACGGNPASKKLEARYSNALFKIDLDRSSATFAKITHAYKGDTDQYYPGLDRQPVCDLFGDQLVYVAWSLACLQLDLDFGSSPNLWRDSLGRLIVGDLQKSGVYHATFGDNMQRNWTAIVAPPCFACNAASPAYADGMVFTMGTPPGHMVALTSESGRYRWAQPAGKGTHFQPVSTANGVVYTIDNSGTLHGFDAANLGAPVLVKSLPADTQSNAAEAGSAGVSIARNTLYAAAGEWLVAYR